MPAELQVNVAVSVPLLLQLTEPAAMPVVRYWPLSVAAVIEAGPVCVSSAPVVHVPVTVVPVPVVGLRDSVPLVVPQYSVPVVPFSVNVTVALLVQ